MKDSFTSFAKSEKDKTIEMKRKRDKKGKPSTGDF